MSGREEQGRLEIEVGSRGGKEVVLEDASNELLEVFRGSVRPSCSFVLLSSRFQEEREEKTYRP